MDLSAIRLRIEARERLLSPLAAKSVFSRGRLVPEEPSPTRGAFQRDRDRLVHCKAFRRLKHKTQVFIAPQGDHYVTRLTHTLQVSQIGRTIARALNVNEDLTEAIALGHDLGHTPFGHVGENALDALVPDGFQHGAQSLRIVDVLENDGKGLNLTWESRDGIESHSKERQSVASAAYGGAQTLEGQIVRWADSVAYVNHDIADAVRAGLMQERDAPSSALAVVGLSGAERINAMVSDIIQTSWAASRADENSEHQSRRLYLADLGDIGRRAEAGESMIRMSDRMLTATDSLREFLFETVYTGPARLEEASKIAHVVGCLYAYYLAHPGEMPHEYSRVMTDSSAQRAVVDYISGMTDQYALRAFDALYVPRLWST